MKLRTPFLAAAGFALAAFSHAATYDATNGYVGAQTVMLTSDANVASADPLIFAVTSGYFNNGNTTQTYTNANVRIDNLTMNNGYSGAVTVFTGTVTGAGSVTLTTAGLAQDFVFAGNMTGYTGAISIAATNSPSNVGISTQLGGGTNSVVQFGGGGNYTGGVQAATAASGTIATDGSSKSYITNVSGTGSVTAVNVVYNYASSVGNYDYLVATNNFSVYQLAQTGSATIVYTGTIAGRNATVSGNSINVAAGTATLRGAVSTMGTIAVAGGTLVTGHARALNAAIVNVASGTLQIGDGITNAVTLASGAALTVADGATLRFVASNASVALNGGTAVLGATSGITLDLNNAFNAAGSYNLLGGGAVTTNAYAITGLDTAHFSATFSNGTLVVGAVPEPSTYGLLGAGALAGLAFVRRRRKAG